MGRRDRLRVLEIEGARVHPLLRAGIQVAPSPDPGQPGGPSFKSSGPRSAGLPLRRSWKLWMMQNPQPG